MMKPAQHWLRDDSEADWQAMTVYKLRGLRTLRIWDARSQARMRASVVVQVENPTPIILSREKSVIRGIHGSVAGSRCMSVVSNMGKRSVGPVSRTNRIADP